MSGNDNGKSATDIITYIGVPLAVLGVLPILYNTFATLASLSQIKRMLRKSRLTALTRSDVVNRVIEIELPRYAVKPLDRVEDGDEYWGLSRHPSSIPGGSWTTFNWRTNPIGIKTQRVEYADQVRQPQVEVAFDDLLSYLLDLGAVPDHQGWKLLRSTGLWTPVGCALMMSPDGREKALTVGPLDDADGNLSLAVAWSSSWITRDHEHLPPYWIRLPSPEPEKERPETSKTSITKKTAKSKGTTGDKTGEGADADSIEQEASSIRTHEVTCQISLAGIVTALVQRQPGTPPQSLYIDHLRTSANKTDGMWFASAATAYGTSSQTILWNYKIPDDILTFARKATVPCGIMVMLDMADDDETPEWATKYHDYGASHDIFVQRHQEQRQATLAEAQMPPAERKAAEMARMQRETMQLMQDMREKTRIDQQRRDQRAMEALRSPPWDPNLVAEKCLRYLKAQNVWNKSLTLKEVAGFILHRMIHDGQFASGLCRMLDTIKSWSDMGGMRKADFYTAQDCKHDFAHATILLALIKDTASALEGTLAMDLQECLRIWKKVRLG